MVEQQDKVSIPALFSSAACALPGVSFLAYCHPGEDCTGKKQGANILTSQLILLFSLWQEIAVISAPPGLP